MPRARSTSSLLLLSLWLLSPWLAGSLALAKDEPAEADKVEVPIEDRNYIEVNGAWYPVFEYPKEAKPTFDPKPTLPAKAKKESRGGIVLLGVLVDQQGLVTDMQVAMSNTEADIEAAAKKAIGRWQFPIKRVDGQPIAYALMVPVRFDATPFFGPQ